MTDIAFRSATQLLAALKVGEISAVEMLEHYLARVERYDGALNAVVVKDVERAKARAAALDTERLRGDRIRPLHGLPMTIKESFNIAGLPTCWGVPDAADKLATADSVVVSRLTRAGANIFGKTNVPVMLGDWQSYNPVYGTTNNPWNTAHSPGGSSGGSAAALAAGLTGLEFGSDIGGSIRVPAHFCGVYGLKPTQHLIPARGQTLFDSVDEEDLNVVGPLARDVEDLELALDLTAGPDLLDADAWTLSLPAEDRRSLAEYKVAVWNDSAIAPVDGAVGAALQSVVDQLASRGAVVDDRARPDVSDADLYRLYIDLLQPIVTMGAPEAEVGMAKAGVGDLDPQDMSRQAMRMRALTMTHQDWISRNEARQKLRYQWHDFFGSYDVVLAPVMGVAAFPHDQSEDRGARELTVNGTQLYYGAQIFWPGICNTAGLPAVAVPIGQTPDGLPVGMQIIAPHWHEKRAIQFARLVKSEVGGFQPPPGFGT